jgi:hypothetical protein
VEVRQARQAAVGAEDGEVRGHAGGQEGGDPEIGLDADIERLHRTGLADRAPVAAGLGEALEHGVSEDAGLIAQRHRQRVAEIGRAVGCADPDQRVAQQLLAAAPRRLLGGQAKVDGAVLELVEQVDRHARRR